MENRFKGFEKSDVFFPEHIWSSKGKRFKLMQEKGYQRAEPSFTAAD